MKRAFRIVREKEFHLSHHQDNLPSRVLARRPDLGKAIALLLLSAIPVMAQSSEPTTINLGTQGRNPDFANFSMTRPMTVGTSLPATCIVGQMFFNSAAPAGSNLYGCTATNVWTLESASGSGGGSQSASATISPGSLSFGTQQQGTQSTAQSITLSNSGSAPLAITGINISGANAGDFSQTNNCGSSLAAAANCTISVTFTPSSTSSETASVNVNDSATNSPQTATLSGAGSASGGSGPVVTPAMAATAPGNTVTVTADRNVTWSLAPGSVGSLSTSSGTSVVYTPPASVAAQHVTGGCMVLPNDSVFNTRIDNLPVNSNSASWVNSMGSSSISIQPAWGVNIVDNTLSATPQTFYYTALNNAPFQIPPTPNRHRETGSLPLDGNNDHHMVSVNRQTCQFYETYQDGLPNSACSSCTAQSGLTYKGTSYALPSQLSGGGSTDAAGLPLAPFLIHLSEIKSGAIKHALRFELCLGCINSGTYLWPATTANGSNVPSAPPMGARFRLKASYSVSGVYGVNMQTGGSGYTTAPTVTISGCQVAPTATATVSGGSVQGVTITSMGSNCTNPTLSFGGPGSGASANALTFPSAAQVVLTALQQYGMILADNGMSGQIQIGTDVAADPSVEAALTTINTARIAPSAFEAVDESALMVSTTSSEVNPSNGYVTPPNYAVVIARDTNGNQTQTPVALQPVTVGVPYTSMTMQAGQSGYQMQSWVNGSSNQSVTWTVQSGVGTITSGGVYTPPASVSGVQTAVLQATAAADSNATVTVYMNVVPSGTIRVDVGNSNSYTDSSGNVWLPDSVSSDIAAYSLQNDNYPTNAWGSVTDAALYQTYKYTWGDDIVYGPFIVPNGNYKIGLNFAVGGCSGTLTESVFDNGLIQGQFALESQGSIQLRVDPLKAANYTCRTPYVTYIPAQVTNNLVYFAVRATGATNTHSAPYLNAFSIAPDATSPYISIDTQQVSTISAGQTAQLYVTGWYMSNSATWSVSGGGTISSTGLYTAPATAPGSPQTITITATSTVDATKTATATLTFQ